MLVFLYFILITPLIVYKMQSIFQIKRVLANFKKTMSMICFLNWKGPLISVGIYYILHLHVNVYIIVEKMSF